MPDEWKKSLQNSMITIEERIQNPQAVINAILWMNQIQNNNQNNNKFYIPSNMIQQYPSDKS